MDLTNKVLEEYLILQQQIKDGKKILDQVKDACKTRGSFVTKDYACLVDTSHRVGLPGLDEVTRCIQRQTLEALGLIRTTEIVMVKIVSIKKYRVETFKDRL